MTRKSTSANTKNWDNHPLLGGFWSGPPHSDPKVSSPKFHQLLQLPVNWSPSPWTRLYSVFLWRSAPCVYFMGKIHPAPPETSKNIKTKLSFFRYRILWRSVWPPWTEWHCVFVLNCKMCESEIINLEHLWHSMDLHSTPAVMQKLSQDIPVLKRVWETLIKQIIIMIVSLARY